MKDAKRRIDKVGRCKLQHIDTRVETAWFQRLKLSCDGLLPSFAFKVKLHHYS